MTLRVGRIPFLVCAPFFHDFFNGTQGNLAVEFVDGPPSVHCAGLKSGRIHLSPASSITYAQKPGAFVLSPELCTSCSFEVRSVKLFSRLPVEDLSNKVIRMTAQSMTSVTLLRILLEIRYNLKPVYANGAYVPETDDACLLIGDQALEENERGRFPYSYDLGSLWQEWQGLPFVFGAWVISKDALSAELRPVTEKYMEATFQSIEHFRQDKEGCLNRWLEQYPVKLPRDVVSRYYDVLDYRFTAEKKDSLQLFFDFAKKMGLVESAPKLEYL